MFGGRVSMAQLGGYKRFVDGLIRDRVVSQEAARLGLSASDAEVAEKIRKQFSDASGQFVGFERYKESVTPRYGDMESFERSVRDEIAQAKLKTFVTAAVKVSDEEVQEDYKRKNTSFDVSYAVISAGKLVEKIQPADEELEDGRRRGPVLLPCLRQRRPRPDVGEAAATRADAVVRGRAASGLPPRPDPDLAPVPLHLAEGRERARHDRRDHRRVLRRLARLARREHQPGRIALPVREGVGGDRDRLHLRHRVLSRGGVGGALRH